MKKKLKSLCTVACLVLFAFFILLGACDGALFPLAHDGMELINLRESSAQNFWSNTTISQNLRNLHVMKKESIKWPERHALVPLPGVLPHPSLVIPRLDGSLKSHLSDMVPTGGAIGDESAEQSTDNREGRSSQSSEKGELGGEKSSVGISHKLEVVILWMWIGVIVGHCAGLPLGWYLGTRLECWEWRWRQRIRKSSSLANSVISRMSRGDIHVHLLLQADS